MMKIIRAPQIKTEKEVHNLHQDLMRNMKKEMIEINMMIEK